MSDSSTNAAAQVAAPRAPSAPDPSTAIAEINDLVAGYKADCSAILGAVTAATAAGDFTTVKELLSSLAAVRSMQTTLRMTLAAYHSGVKSAPSLLCYLQLYNGISDPDIRADARKTLAIIISRFDSETSAVSEAAIADLASKKTAAEEKIRREREATRWAEEATERARAATRQAEETTKLAEETTKQAELTTQFKRDEAAALIRIGRAKFRLELRQMAFDKSHALWKVSHSVYDITDADIDALLSGMSLDDMEALRVRATA
jgi:hypothetical protein